jgi:hypothetical protein
MTSSTAKNVFSISDLLGDRVASRKNGTVTTKVDENLLVLSCVIYRLCKQDKANKMLSLKESRLSNLVTQEDRNLAEKITKHFQQKMLVLKLKNVPLTPYRQDLMNFINNTDGQDVEQGYIYPDTYLGLAYKLPYFYFYDLEITNMFGGEFVAIKGETQVKGELTLEFIKTTTPYKKYNNIIEYWFTDQNQNKVMLPVESQNVLINLFEQHVKSQSITIKAKFSERKKDNISFLTPDNKFKLVL